jgi:hypothetical protein
MEKKRLTEEIYFYRDIQIEFICNPQLPKPELKPKENIDSSVFMLFFVLFQTSHSYTTGRLSQ